MYVGMPADLMLHEFGSQVWHAFGTPPFLVGSALLRKDWRDVDVRLILDDDVYLALGLGGTHGDPLGPGHEHSNGKWVALCLAFSALGKQMTGLPIDFQIQSSTWANKVYEKQPRSALGVVDLRIKKD
jgi:hypothetical protein